MLTAMAVLFLSFSEGLEANFEIEVSIYAMEIYNASCEEPSEVC